MRPFDAGVEVAGCVDDGRLEVAAGIDDEAFADAPVVVPCSARAVESVTVLLCTFAL